MIIESIQIWKGMGDRDKCVVRMEGGKGIGSYGLIILIVSYQKNIMQVQ
jgi:hypothetical protein